MCHELTQDNRDYMQLYYDTHQPGMLFKCYFYPSTVLRDGAVLRRTIHWSLAVHVVLWPGLTLFIGIGWCSYMVYKKKCKRKEYELDIMMDTYASTAHICDPYNDLERF